MNTAPGGETPVQQWRLRRFRTRYPGVVITQHDSFGYWQAWIPVTDGGTLITRYALADLLDALEELNGSALFGG
jgi:hypothetical protein